jgi:hypothetical protein
MSDFEYTVELELSAESFEKLKSLGGSRVGVSVTQVDEDDWGVGAVVTADSLTRLVSVLEDTSDAGGLSVATFIDAVKRARRRAK